MDRLNVWVIALAVLGLSACSGSSPVADRGNAGQSGLDHVGRTGVSLTEGEVAVPLEGSIAPRELTALLSPAKAPLGLPPLPFDGLPAKLPQRLEQSLKDGNQSYSASANASNAGSTKVLDSTDGELAWAVYEVPLLSGTATITKLYVTISDHLGSADGPQGWVYGMANYATNTWQALGYTRHLATVRTMNVTEPYRGPGGNAYIFIATSNLQQVTVQQVGFDLDIVGWEEVTLDTNSSPDWTQAIDFTLTDNPVIAYTKPISNKIWFVVADRQTDVLNPVNWQPTEIDPTNTRPPSWIDLVIDDATGYPRACYITSGHPPATGRTQLTFAALFPFTGDSTIWLPFALQRNDHTFEDGAEWTSLAVNPLYANTFGFVTHVANDTFRLGDPNELAYDMQYRTFQIDDPEDASSPIFVDRTTGFGEDWLFPHLAYSDGGVIHGFSANGGNNFGGSNLAELALILEEGNSTNFGSMATRAADDTLGSTFVATPLDEDRLMYVDYDESLLYNSGTYPQEVATAGTQTGGFIGVSQLAYAPDGSPGIVFTESDGTSVYVRYAMFVNDAWVVENVSDDPSTPTGMDPLAVIVDLAFDSTGVPAVCYNHVAGSTGSLRFAIRGE